MHRRLARKRRRHRQALGCEWFSAPGRGGERALARALVAAAGDVRHVARRRGKLPSSADRRCLLETAGVGQQHLFAD